MNRRIERTHALWALLAAIGASYLITGLALVLRELALPKAREVELALTNRTIYLAGIPEAVLFAIAIAVSATTAAFVARRAGGAAAALLYVALMALAAVAVVVEAITREGRLRGSECCVVATVADMPLAAGAMFLPAAVGAAVGTMVARRRSERPGTNALLEAAGAYGAVGGLAVFAFGAPASMLVFAPYATLMLAALPHALALLSQIVIASAVYVVRRGTFAPRMLGAFALMGLAGVAYFDVLEIWFTLFLDHRYVPVSLFVVPLASVALGAAAVLAWRSIARRSVP
jgi:hypothetical protein